MRRDELFRPLDPPPGGLARLRERIARDEARSRRHLAAWLAPAAVGLATAALLLIPRGDRQDLRASIPLSASAIALGLRSAEPLEIGADARGRAAALRVATGDPAVVFYQVDAAGADR